MIEATDPYVVDLYCKILLRANSVIFCRSSPKEKALIVKFVKRNLKFMVLGIGDGGNDVGMIEEAQIGVGIIGK
jgi:P-type E1-E2 ATPase